MSIFITALKNLISQKLSHRATDLFNQTSGWLSGMNDVALSNAQKDVIDELNKEIIKYDPKNHNDKQAYTSVISLIDAARKKIVTERTKQGASPDGETTKCLKDLVSHISDFYNKLEDFEKKYGFKLLDLKYVQSPEYIIYYHAAHYMGNEFFNPRSKIDLQVRAKKEEFLAQRLIDLNVLTQSVKGLEQRRAKALKILIDLKRDNVAASQGEKARKYTMDVSFMGFSPTLKASASLGRMKAEFDQAKKAIEDMTEKLYQGPKDSVRAADKRRDSMRYDERDELHDADFTEEHEEKEIDEQDVEAVVGSADACDDSRYREERYGKERTRRSEHSQSRTEESIEEEHSPSGISLL